MPLTEPNSNSHDSFEAERRSSLRQAPNSLSYVHLDESNGGILINVSEGGLAVQAAMSVMEDDLPRVRMQMPRSKTWLETSARVAWTSDARRTVGIEFVDPPQEFRKQLGEWLSSEASGQASAHAAETEISESDAHGASVHEIPMHIRRRTQQAHAQSLNTTDFDITSVLASHEMAGVTVTRSVKVPAEPVHTAPAIAALPKESAAPAAKPVEKKKRRGAQWVYAPLIVVLAALSLGAGWEAGQGRIVESAKALFTTSSAASAAAKPVARTGVASALATNFEVIDANNQAWLVPFSGPTSAPAGPALPALPPRAAATLNQPPPKKPASFQLWNLSAPQSSSRSKLSQNPIAPVLPAPQGASTLAPLAAVDPSILPAPPSGASIPRETVHSDLIAPRLLRSPQPVYPTPALNQRIEGPVKLQARIEANGDVTNIKALTGSPVLVPAAITAVRNWKYKPEMLDGQPVASDIVITIQFSLPH